MKALVGVTDNRWAAYLRDHPQLSEANFWLPRTQVGFRALSVGEPFLFKTHWPENQLVGGGFFSGYDVFSVAEAWELFGEGNGVATEPELARAVGRYRKERPDSATRIGCVLLRDIFFAPAGESLPAPADFASNIVRYKGYDLGGSGAHVDYAFRALLDVSDVRVGDDTGVGDEVPGPVFGAERLTQTRLGQRAFKGLVLTSYQRRCAVTGNHIRPTLEAAHIRPVSRGGQNRVSNGLLLRSDVHTLFDLGYLGVSARYELQVSPRLRTDWGNGKEFYELAGRPIRVPGTRGNRPDRSAIEWHLDTVFLR